MTLSFADACYRCPNCNELPKATVSAPGIPGMPVILFCERHGHMAAGSSLKQTIGHWNRYIQGLMTKFPECLVKPARTKAEKAILNAAFGIDANEDK